MISFSHFLFNSYGICCYNVCFHCHSCYFTKWKCILRHYIRCKSCKSNNACRILTSSFNVIQNNWTLHFRLLDNYDHEPLAKHIRFWQLPIRANELNIWLTRQWDECRQRYYLRNLYEKIKCHRNLDYQSSYMSRINYHKYSHTLTHSTGSI